MVGITGKDAVGVAERRDVRRDGMEMSMSEFLHATHVGARSAFAVCRSLRQT